MVSLGSRSSVDSHPTVFTHEGTGASGRTSIDTQFTPIEQSSTLTTRSPDTPRILVDQPRIEQEDAHGLLASTMSWITSVITSDDMVAEHEPVVEPLKRRSSAYSGSAASAYEGLVGKTSAAAHFVPLEQSPRITTWDDSGVPTTESDESYQERLDQDRQQWEHHVKSVKEGKMAGIFDWALPTVEVLQTAVDTKFAVPEAAVHEMIDWVTGHETLAQPVELRSSVHSGRDALTPEGSGALRRASTDAQSVHIERSSTFATRESDSPSADEPSEERLDQELEAQAAAKKASLISNLFDWVVSATSTVVGVADVVSNEPEKAA